jgi:hypothetical protein
VLERCGSCGTRYAVGLPACPHCRSTVREGDVPAGDDGQDDGSDDEEADVAKITKSGVTFPAQAAEPPAEPAAEAPVPEAAPEAVPAPEPAPEPEAAPEEIPPPPPPWGVTSV